MTTFTASWTTLLTVVSSATALLGFVAGVFNVVRSAGVASGKR